MAKVYEPWRLRAAWQRVKSNAGAAGIDQMTVKDFAQKEDELLMRIHDKLVSGTYRFEPAKRVLIPKPGSSKMRKLGIPVVMDRIVGLSMHSILEGIFDPGFTERYTWPVRAVLLGGAIYGLLPTRFRENTSERYILNNTAMYLIFRTFYFALFPIL